MSESETTEATDQDAKQGNNSRKRVRHRKKQMYGNILKQMEFYFSDANLTKDRFLGDLVKSDPYVPLDVFLKFNKIRAITQDVNDIAKAMKNSTFLELSEDKLKVKRKTPVEPYDVGLRTVYVESIPVTASREWLQRVFSEYGKVAYISLPKFKNSQKIKGYGFIEFNRPEEAQKCLNKFTKMGCKLPTCMPPEELSSIKTFSLEETHDEATDVKHEKKHEEECEPPKKKKKREKKSKHLELKLGQESDAEKKPKHLELKLGQESDAEKKPKHLELKLGQESDAEKKSGTPTPSTPNEENKNIVANLTEERKPDVETPTESKDDLTSQDEEKDGVTKKKKTRKRTAKERNKAKHRIGPNDASKDALWGLQVLSKAEWKALRNKYLNLQRKYMKEIKNSLRIHRHTYSAIPEPAASAEAEPVINPQEGATDKAVPPLERISGVFVKEVLPEPCTDVRLTKSTIRSNIHVLHVEAKEGQAEVIIRFDSAKAADEYCAQSETRARVLSGGEEEEQWSRAAAARAVKRTRGRDKLLQRFDTQRAAAALAPAEPQPTHTHIRFDDE